MNAATAKQTATEVKFAEKDFLRIMSLIEDTARKGKYRLIVEEILDTSTKHTLEMEGFKCWYPKRLKKTIISWE